MVKTFDQTSDTPELIWDSNMRTELRTRLGQQLDLITKLRTENNDAYTLFELSPDFVVRYANLEKELNIGGVYVSRFLKEPTYNLRDPGGFLELLLQRWGKELETFISPSAPSQIAESTTVAEAGQDILDLLTTAAVYVCRVRDVLCDKLATWGYMSNCITYLEQVLDHGLFGSPLLAVIRILHVAANRKANIESLSLVGHSDGRRGMVEFTMKAIDSNELHKDAAFMVEFLKKSFHLALGDLNGGRSNSFAMAPSPAPGEGPVRRKVNIGDDPLGMFQSTQPQVVNQVAPTSFESSHTHLSSPMQTQPNQAVISTGAPQPTWQPQPQPQPQQQLNMTTASNGYTQQGVHPLQSPHQPNQTQQQYSLQQSHGQSQHLQRSHEAQSISSGFAPQGNHPLGNPNTSTPYQPLQHPFAGAGIANQSGSNNFGVAKATQQAEYAQKIAELQRQKEMKQTTTFQKLVNDGKQGLTSFQGSMSQVSSTLQGSVSQVSSSLFKSDNVQQNSVVQQPSGFQGNNSQLWSQRNNVIPPANPMVGQQRTAPIQQHQQAMSSQVTQQNFNNQPYSAVQGAPQHRMTTPNYQQQPNPVPRAQPNQMAQQQTVQSPQYSQASSIQQHTQFQHPQQAMSLGQQTPFSAPSAVQNQLPATTLQYMGQPQVGNGQPSINNSNTSLPGLAGSSYNPVGTQQPYPAFNAGPGMGQTLSGQNGYYGVQNTVVETVEEETVAQMHVQQQTPTAVEGAGVDARTPEDPNIVAERQATTTSGAPGSAHGRVSLLQQAIACNLCEFLVDKVLENSALSSIRDPSAAKVHSIEILKMLSKDPGYGPKFKMILDGLPAWKKYKTQDHSLLITGHEQKADYFLTNGSSTETKMLTES